MLSIPRSILTLILGFSWIWSTLEAAGGNPLFSSTARLAALAEQELQFLDRLENFLSNNAGNIRNTRLTHGYLKQQRALLGSSTHPRVREALAHPLAAFALLRRLTKEWHFVLTAIQELPRQSPVHWI